MRLIKYLSISLLITMLSGCGEPDTPSEVAIKAVRATFVNQDFNEALKYCTEK